MNFRAQISSHVTLTKFLLAICLLMLTTAFKCTFSDDVLFPTPPPFPGGIRIETQEGLANMAVGGIAVVLRKSSVLEPDLRRTLPDQQMLTVSETGL